MFNFEFMKNEPVLIDSNVVCDFLLGEPEFNEQAQEFFRQCPQVLGHGFILSEVGNVICTYVRRGKIPSATGYDLLHAATDLFIVTEEPKVLDMYQVATEFNLTFYDATHVATALALETPLITRDKKILKNCSHTATSIKDFLKA